MPRGAKLSITNSGHTKPPDFSIPVPAAKHHDAPAQHHEEAARHHQQAAKLYQSSHRGKVSHRAHLAHVHRLRAEQRAEEAAKAQMKNHFAILTETALVEKFRKKSGENS